MTVVTSKKSAVKIKTVDALGTSKTVEIYTATRSTKNTDGTYKIEILQYPTDGSGDENVIGTRNSVNNWTWNDNVVGVRRIDLGRQVNNNLLNKTSQNQMESMRRQFVETSQEAEEFNRANAQPNKATTPPGTGDGNRPSGEPPKNVAKTRDQFGIMNYPIDREERLQDIIKFDMLKYEPKKVDGFTFGTKSKLKDRKSIGSVTLPIPGGISDANACNWGDDTMGPLQLAGAAIALNLLDTSKNIPGGVSGVLGNLKNQIVDNNKVIKDAIGTATAAAAVGSNINSLLSRTQGMILNPNLELLFQAPTLRPFTFQFKMSPRSADEAKEIVKIIRFFKQGMAPIREESRLFLKTPHTFKIRYLQLGEESKFLNKFKECALLSCSIQYTPEGNYAPYEDGAMSSYQMSLQFKELEPVYNDEYANDNDASIGF